MNILVLDTSLGSGTVGLCADGRVAEAATIEDPRGLAEHLVPTIDAVLGRAGIDYAALDKIAVTVGPGTFTGLRIGLAAARAIGLAADCPVVGITTLEALGEAFVDRVDEGGIIVAAIDARRGQVYFQAFSRTAGELIAVSQSMALDIEDIASHLPDGPVDIVGSGAAHVAAVRQNGVRILGQTAQISADVLCCLARRQTSTGRAPSPLYLREPDAKLPNVS